MSNKPHHPECLCETCERTSAGYFAQRAARAGDTSAAHRLSPAVYRFMAAERARRASAKRRLAATGQCAALDVESAAR